MLLVWFSSNRTYPNFWLISINSISRWHEMCTFPQLVDLILKKSISCTKSHDLSDLVAWEYSLTIRNNDFLFTFLQVKMQFGIILGCVKRFPLTNELGHKFHGNSTEIITESRMSSFMLNQENCKERVRLVCHQMRLLHSNIYLNNQNVT